MSRRARPNAAGLIVMLACVHALPVEGQGAARSSTTVVSPAVAATLVVRPTTDGQLVDLLVLWRGAPGWFTAQPQTVVAGERRRDVFAATLTYGDIRLELEFNTRLRIATLAGLDLPLEADNVILVDDVDSTPRVFRTLRVGRDLADDSDVFSVLRRSDELVDYLRCGVSVGDEDRDTALARLCALVGGG